jgi:uncharacterized membrane protein
MRPEVASASQESKVKSQQSAEGGEQSEAAEDDGLTDEERKVLNLLKENSPVDLNELKGQTGLSNKKWDKAIKGLTKNKLAKVEKTDEGLFVSLL